MNTGCAVRKKFNRLSKYEIIIGKWWPGGDSTIYSGDGAFDAISTYKDSQKYLFLSYPHSIPQIKIKTYRDTNRHIGVRKKFGLLNQTSDGKVLKFMSRNSGAQQSNNTNLSAVSIEYYRGKIMSKLKGGASPLITFRVPNWEKYNPRSDRKKHSWFRLEIDWYDDDSLHGLTWQQKSLWPVFLSAYAKKHSDGFATINAAHIAEKVKMPIEKVLSAFKAFYEKGVLEVEQTDDAITVTGGDRSVSTGITTNERTDDTNERYVTYGATPQLVSIWNENRECLPEVIKVTKPRANRIARVWPDFTAEEWMALVKRAAASDYCNGLTDSSNWIATFDWFIGEKDGLANYLRVKEGNYDNRTKKPSGNEEWIEKAHRVFTAVRKFGSNGGEEAKTYLGEELLNRVRAIGGLSSVGQMKNDEFSVKKLAGLLQRVEVST